MSWRSSPTRQRSCAWPPPWSSNPTTNGRSPGATFPMSPWTNYALSSPRNTLRQHLPNNTKSPSVQHDSLITPREPRQIRSPPPPGTLSFITQLAEFTSTQQQHGQPFQWGEYLHEFFASTFENWQSEWLQLIFQAILLLGAKHWIFKVDAEDLERI